MGKVLRQERFCKDCPRRQEAHEQHKDKGKYYCQGKSMHFNDEEHSCSPRRKTSRLTRLNNRMKEAFKSNGLEPSLYVTGGVSVVPLAKPIEPNNIVFQIKDREILKLCEDGTIYINGRLAGNDREVVEGMRELIKGFRRN